MNMIDAQVAKNGADVTLAFGGHTLTLPQAKGKALEEAGYERGRTYSWYPSRRSS